MSSATEARSDAYYCGRKHMEDMRRCADRAYEYIYAKYMAETKKCVKESK